MTCWSYWCFHFMEERIETQKGKIIQDYTTNPVAEQGFEPSQTIALLPLS